ncbi:MAG: DUF4097 family beta strand repeat-containing protein [Spirosomataceae bacterium]
MKNLRKILVASLFTVAFYAQAQERETLTIPLSDPSKESKLNLSLVTGSIRVVSYAGKDIVVDAVVAKDEETKSRPAEKDGMKRLNVGNAGFEITAKEVNNVVKVGVDKPTLNVSFTVKVPQKTSLKLSTVNNGDIYVDNVNGNLEISNVNGDIKLKNIAGSVSANTINGDVIVNFTDVTANSAMAFTNLNGKIDVAFPANYKANVKLKTDRGDIYSDFDIDIDKTNAKAIQTTDKEKGLYKLKKDDWTYGKINGGGAEMTMKSMNGDIFIRKAK